MSFFGPGSLLSGYEPSPPGGLDPQLYKALMSAFPGLQGLGGQQGQPSTLQSLGYQGMGPQFFQGQGSGSFQNLSPFEGAKGFGSESITGGLASGTLGKSQSQQAPTGSGLLSLPQLQLPQAVAAQQGAYGQLDAGAGAGGGEPQGGITIGAGDVLGAGQQLYDLFGGGSTLGTQTQTPGYQAYRQGERTDYSGATGSPGGLPQSLQGLNLGALNSTLVLQQSLPQGTTFSPIGDQSLLTAPGALPTQYSLPSDATFSMPGAGETMTAPGGSAQTALGQPAPQGDLLGGGISTLQGLLSLYGGVQSGNIGQLLGGTAGMLGGLGQMAPETLAQLSQALGLGQGGLDLAAGGLGGLAGGYGLYQGIEQGDPLQAVLGAAGLYQGAAPIANALGANLPSISQAAGQLLAQLSPSIAQALGFSVLPAIGAAVPGGIAAAGATAGSSLGALGALGGGGAMSGVAGSAGGAAGAAGGGLAGAAASLPMVAMIIGTAVNSMLASKQDAFDLGQRFKSLTGQIPGKIASLQNAPALLAQLNDPAVTPQQAADVYRQLEAIQQDLDQSGVEDFLQTGRTGIVGSRSNAAGPTSAQFSQGPEIWEALTPYLQALDVGRMRATDIAARGGAPIEGARPLFDYTMLGSPQFMEALRPGSALPGQLPQYLGIEQNVHVTPDGRTVVTGSSAPRGYDIGGAFYQGVGGDFGRNIQDTSFGAQAAGPELLKFAGLPTQDTSRTPLTQEDLANWAAANVQGDMGQIPQELLDRAKPLTSVADVSRYLSPGGAGLGGPAQQYGMTPYGFANLPLFNQVQAVQPGQYEQGLSQLFGQYGGAHPMLSEFGFGTGKTPIPTDPAQQALQQYMQQLGTLQGQLPQLAQAAQQMPTGGLDAGALAALQPQAPSGFSGVPNTGGGMNQGVDLMALLRQLGYVA